MSTLSYAVLIVSIYGVATGVCFGWAATTSGISSIAFALLGVGNAAMGMWTWATEFDL